MIPKDHLTTFIQKFATPGGRHIDLQYGAKIPIVLLISIGPRTEMQVSIRCFRCL